MPSEWPIITPELLASCASLKARARADALHILLERVAEWRLLRGRTAKGPQVGESEVMMETMQPKEVETSGGVRQSRV